MRSQYVDVTVLMSVYFRESESNLKESLDSIVNQTYLPRQFVIVKDGRLGDKLEKVLGNFFSQYEVKIDIIFVELPKLVNLGMALNAGLNKCTLPLVARMDSDDHAMPNRLELQFEFLKENKNVKILGGTIQEFLHDWRHPVSFRHVPTHTPEIIKFSRKRNPLNHMTVMFRKDFVSNVMGGYHDVPGFEDYELWLRSLDYDGDSITSMSEVLVAARISSLQSRRGGFGYVRKNTKARWRFFRLKLISFPDFVLTFVGGILVSLSPAFLRRILYDKILRTENRD